MTGQAANGSNTVMNSCAENSTAFTLLHIFGWQLGLVGSSVASQWEHPGFDSQMKEHSFLSMHYKYISLNFRIFADCKQPK